MTDNKISDLQKDMSLMHLAKTNAALELLNSPEANVHLKLLGLNLYVGYNDMVKNILLHQKDQLEKAINGEENDFWE